MLKQRRTLKRLDKWDDDMTTKQSLKFLFHPCGYLWPLLDNYKLNSGANNNCFMLSQKVIRFPFNLSGISRFAVSIRDVITHIHLCVRKYPLWICWSRVQLNCHTFMLKENCCMLTLSLIQFPNSNLPTFRFSNESNYRAKWIL